MSLSASLRINFIFSRDAHINKSRYLDFLLFDCNLWEISFDGLVITLGVFIESLYLFLWPVVLV